MRPSRSRRSALIATRLKSRFPRVAGYRVELPEERLTAQFNDDSVLELTPDLVGPSITRNAGIIGEGVELSLEHLGDMRPSTLLFHVAKRLALHEMARSRTKNPSSTSSGSSNASPRNGSTAILSAKAALIPAQLMYQELADMACDRITAAIVRDTVGKSPIKAIARPLQSNWFYQLCEVHTSKTDRWETDARRCHINWVILDSDWEAEFCRVAESHPRVKSYVKNHNLGLEVPYRFGSENRKYRPDFIVLVDDGHGEDDPLHLIVEIKGYRREDAKEKKATMETYWVPGVNNSGKYGRWAFAEFTEVYQIESDFAAKVEAEFNKMIESVTSVADGVKNLMAKNSSKQKEKKKVETLTHDKAKRRNIPTAEFQSVMRVDEQSPIRVHYERRNRDLDPQLVWRGKDEQDWSDLVVHAPPLYIQEKVHPKVLIDDLQRRSEGASKASASRRSIYSPTSTASQVRAPRRSSTSTMPLEQSDDPRRQPTGRWHL